MMANEERQGTLERLTEKGVFLSGTWYGYSNYLKGDRLLEAHIGCPVTVLVHEYKDKLYIDKVKAIGEKIPGYKPPEAPRKGFQGGGGGWRVSPEELELKVATESRIRRERALEFAMTLRERGLSIDEISPDALKLEAFFGRGLLPEAAPSLPRKKPALSSVPAAESSVPPRAGATPVPAQKAADPSDKAGKNETAPAVRNSARIPTRAVSALYNQAMRARVVKDWKDYEALIRKALGRDMKDVYDQSAEELAKVQAVLQAKLGQSKVA
jgi:hypothetical protein